MNPSHLNSSKWFVCPRSNPNAEFRLFIFPFAGGGPASFSKWNVELPQNIETWIAHYPGRGSRYKEPPLDRIDKLIEGLAQAIQPLLDKPFAFFGHSFGGQIAFELAKQKEPTTLFISGCGAPSIPNPHPQIHHLPDSDFIGSLQTFNGIPDEVIGNPELMALLLPMLRADFEALENYRPNSYELNCPILAFGGIDDPRISRERLEGWASHTNSHFETHYFPGDHFFINTAAKDVMNKISARIIERPYAS